MTLTQIKPAGLSKPVDLADNEKIRLGTGNDLEIYHDGSNSFLLNATGEFQIANSGSGNTIFLQAKAGENSIRAIANGAAELYHNGTKTFETTSTGAQVTGRLAATTSFTGSDGVILKLGDSDDLQIYHDGSGSHITESGTGLLDIDTNTFRVRNTAGNENQITAETNGAVRLYYDNSTKFETIAAGCQVTGNIYVNDGNTFTAGNSNDLRIYHDGNSSWIKNTAGDLIVNTPNFYVNNAAQTETMISAIENGAVSLKYDNSTKFETKSSGVGVTGNLEVGSGQITCGVHGTTGIQIINDGTFGTLHSADLTFRTVSSPRMTIDTSGNVGIGTTSPHRPIHQHVPSSGSNYHQFTNSTTGSGSGDGGIVGLDGNEDLILWHQESQNLRFGTSNTERMRVQSGGGISFNGDTAQANALDDYEEGTWTPVISFGYNTYNQSYSHQQGQYTKIGNRVFCTCYVHFSNKGTASGIARLGGLPFTNANITVNYAVGAFWINQWNGGPTVPTGYAQVNTSHVRLERQRCDNPSSSFGVSTCDNTNFNNATDLMCSVTFRVA